MITNNQINSLSDDELSYLVMCFAKEWEHTRLPYEFKFNFIKFYRNDAIQPILNKYSANLKDEYKNIVFDILNKLEENK